MGYVYVALGFGIGGFVAGIVFKGWLVARAKAALIKIS